MKKLLIFVMLIALSNVVFAQKDVTKFLGIPVDGTKEEMIQELKAKGFRSSSHDREVLEGEFNGTKVTLHVVTNKNKVYRIMVADKIPRNEPSIKIRFNTLCKQFNNNPNYISFDDYEIPENEDISYEITAHHKRYEAAFYQKPDVTDSLMIKNMVRDAMLSRYAGYVVENPTEDAMDKIQSDVYKMYIDRISYKSVWFMISELYGEYYIAMYYDNKYNEANGEDL
ncbi:MAG: hypothetical protein J1E04_01875 [Alistipes sp.]|nr:hypothetical protein [Alistipes sp.]